jgi:hypothetical protein
LTPPSSAGSLPRINGGATFNESGGNNYAGALTLGLNRGVGVYNLSGGTLNPASEALGGDSASTGLFYQTAGVNPLYGLPGILSVFVRGGSFYEISGSSYSADSGFSELNASGLWIKSNGVFNQTGGLVEVGGVRLDGSGDHMLSGGTLESGGNVKAGQTGAASPDLRAASRSSVSAVSTRTAWLLVAAS